jgi:hypothetical protein
MSGLTPSERAVMNHWDAGLGSSAIAIATGLSERRVTRIISTFHDPGEERGAAADMTRASTALLAALQAAR